MTIDVIKGVANKNLQVKFVFCNISAWQNWNFKYPVPSPHQTPFIMGGKEIKSFDDVKSKHSGNKNFTWKYLLATPFNNSVSVIIKVYNKPSLYSF